MEEAPMPNSMYLTVEEAAHKYGVKKRVLTQLIEDGMVQTRKTSTGDLLVVADKNGNGQESQTKEEIIADKYAHLRGRTISASEASRRYSRIHGIPISNQLFSRWGQLGHITVLERGYRLQLDEADVAYCAEIYAQKYGEYKGQMSGVRIFDEEGNPYQLKYPEVAEQLRKQRRLTRQKG
jgi:hypothetical protein